MILGQHTCEDMMTQQYHKIQTVFKRDPETKFKTLLEGEFSLPEFEYLKKNDWVWTEKVDGTNIRVMWDGEKVVFGGKTERAQIPANLFQRLQELFPTEFMASLELPPMTLYGEGFGARIQKGGGNYIPKGVNFCLFDVFCDMWLERDSVIDIGTKLAIPIAPVINTGRLDVMVEYVRGGFRSFWGDFQAEGIVARPATELLTRRGKRIITKLKCKDFTNDAS